MQHFQFFPSDTFVCGADAVGRRNSRLDPDPRMTTCPECKATPGWKRAWEGRTKSAAEIQTERFDTARQKTRDIPDSQYVALVKGKVRMGLSTYEALAKAATSQAKDRALAEAKPDLTAEEYNTVMESLMARVGSAPRGMDTTLLATANTIKDKFGASTRRRAEAKPDDQSSPAKPVTHHYKPGYFTTTCSERIADVRYIDSDWAKTTCPDCLSYYRPEDDPAQAPLVHYYNPSTDSSACGIGRRRPMATSDQWRRVTCPNCRRSPLAQITVEASRNRHEPAPRFEHDCDACIFLGSETVGGVWHDLYFHPDERQPSVLARESSEGGDYRSGMNFVDRDGALALAFIRAQRRGLL
jgi:RNase P subunit RPR2